MAGTGARAFLLPLRRRRNRLPACSRVVGGRFGNRAEFLCCAEPPNGALHFQLSSLEAEGGGFYSAG